MVDMINCTENQGRLNSILLWSAVGMSARHCGLGYQYADTCIAAIHLFGPIHDCSAVTKPMKVNRGKKDDQWSEVVPNCEAMHHGTKGVSR